MRGDVDAATNCGPVQLADGAVPRPPWTRSLRVVWPVTFLLFCALGTLWVFTSPLGSGPDEIEHIVKAVGTARGEWIGRAAAGHIAAFRSFRVPATYVHVGYQPLCFRKHISMPASCAPRLVASSKLVQAISYVGRYPPTYPALVGSPTLVTTSVASLYWMRIVSVAASAVFLSLAVSLAATRGSALVIAGVFAGITPTVAYLASVIQPDGLEAAAAICMWTAFVLLTRSEPGNPSRLLVHAAGSSAVVVVLVRALGPIWFLVALAVTFGVVAPPRRLLGLWRTRGVRIWALVIALAVAGQAAWMAATHDLDVVPRRTGHLTQMGIAGAAAGRLPVIFRGMVGGLYPLGNQGPGFAMTLIWLLLGTLVALAFLYGTNRERLAIVVVATTCAVFPIISALATYRTAGIVWQGRYSLPVAVGVPIIAGAAAARMTARGAHGGDAPARRRRATGVAMVVISGFLLAQIVLLYALLRRFTVGTNGPIDIVFTRTSWVPPLPASAIVCSSLALMLLLAGWCWLLCNRSNATPTTHEARERCPTRD